MNKGWHDKDETFLQDVFQLLMDCDGQEQPERFIDWNADKN